MQECQYIDDTERHDISSENTSLFLDLICFYSEVCEFISDEREEISSREREARVFHTVSHLFYDSRKPREYPYFIGEESFLIFEYSPLYSSSIITDISDIHPGKSHDIPEFIKK